MNTARDRNASALVLQLSELSTEELNAIVNTPKSAAKYTAKYYRAAEHVLLARAITTAFEQNGEGARKP